MHLPSLPPLSHSLRQSEPLRSESFIQEMVADLYCIATGPGTCSAFVSSWEDACFHKFMVSVGNLNCLGKGRRLWEGEG